MEGMRIRRIIAISILMVSSAFLAPDARAASTSPAPEDNLIYDGERIVIRQDGTVSLQVRSLYVATSEGIEVYRARVNQPLKKIGNAKEKLI